MLNPQADLYDLVVLGGGPAGIIGAATAAMLGRRVALVDSQAYLGGAGANTGTVPSKTLRETALALSGWRSRNLYGVDLSLRREATVADFLRHERNVKAGLNVMLKQRLEASQAKIYQGTACFADAHTVQVRRNSAEDDIHLRAEYVLIATGSAPVRPAMFSFGRDRIYDSDTVLNLDRLPATLAVVGAGVIGSEYASTFAALGTEVHVVAGHHVLLPFLDAEMSQALAAAMARNGIRFHWDERVESCVNGEPEKISLMLTSGERLAVDAVLVTAGRKSNVDGLGLSAANIATSERGLIPVNEHFQTEAAHIYAAGDVIGFPALASTSMQQARLAMRHAFGQKVLRTHFEFCPPVFIRFLKSGPLGKPRNLCGTRASSMLWGVDHIKLPPAAGSSVTRMVF